MDIAFMVVCAIVVIGFLVIIHEGGHFLAARAFGVRVTELMVGLPGPSVGVTRNGTRFGVTAVPLGGYAKVCGMETGPVSPHLKDALVLSYKQGRITVSECACALGVDEEDAQDALDELVEWGSLVAPKTRDTDAEYSTPEYVPSAKMRKEAHRLCMAVPQSRPSGASRAIGDADAFYAREYAQTYRSLPLWKKSVILLAGIGMNLIFAILAFVVIYSVIGIDVSNPQTGEVTHFNATPLQAVQAGFNVIGMTFSAILSLFNPQTAAETVSNSTSIVGIAVMSADYFAQGFVYALFFMALISVSLGLMNLIPIPPLDGGRFLIEIIQKVTRRQLSTRALGYISMAGMAVFICFFIFMLNQDIQRFVFGNW